MIVNQDYSILFCVLPALLVVVALVVVWRS